MTRSDGKQADIEVKIVRHVKDALGYEPNNHAFKVTLKTAEGNDDNSPFLREWNPYAQNGDV